MLPPNVGGFSKGEKEMHKRIYQISSSPIEEDEQIIEEDFYGTSFLGNVADYVKNLSEEETEKTWGDLLDGLFAEGSVFIDKDADGNRYFKVTAPENHLLQRFDKFREAAEILAVATPEQYMEYNGVVSDALWKLKYAYDDKFGDYMYVEGELMSIPKFFRYYGNNPDTKWYTGGVVGYHA